MSHRRVLSLTGLCLAACLAVGCIPALSPRISRAEYPGGVSFVAKGQAPYDCLQWQGGNANPPPPCPLVLHLPGGDLTAQDLADAKQLQDRGWVKSYQDNGVAAVEYQWRESAGGVEKTLAQVTLTGGVLTRVLLRTTGNVSATIGGKHVALPITSGQLEQLLGKPLR